MSFLRKLGFLIPIAFLSACADGETGAGTEGGGNGTAGGGQGGAGQGGAGQGGGGGQGGEAGDGGQGGGGGAGGGGQFCYSPASSIPFERTCATSVDCELRFHMIDCCGTLAAVGIYEGDAAAFDMVEAMCQPVCDCVAKPTVADDGKTSDNAAAFQVSCVSGICKTSVP